MLVFADVGMRNIVAHGMSHHDLDDMLLKSVVKIVRVEVGRNMRKDKFFFNVP